MARLTAEQWQAIRTEWETNPSEPTYNLAAGRASEKFKFAAPGKTTIESRAKKEGWERRGSMNGINVAAQRKADAITNSDGGAKVSDGSNPEKSDGSEIKKVQAARAESEDLRAEVIARHRTEWKQIAVLRQEALAIRVSNPGAAFEKSKLAKINAEITAIQQAGERKAWGLGHPGGYGDCPRYDRRAAGGDHQREDERIGTHARPSSGRKDRFRLRAAGRRHLTLRSLSTQSSPHAPLW